MAVYKRAYASYTGSHTAPRSRFLVLARYGWSDLFTSRIFTSFYVLIAFVPFLVGALIIYISNTPAVQALLDARRNSFLVIDRDFFMGWMQVAGWFSFLLSAWVGPSLVSPELTNGALPLFLSRPFSRTEYVLGKAAVLAVLISLIGMVPALLLFVIQASLAPSGWLTQNLSMVPAIIFASLLWIAFLCAVSLAISAWVRWRVVATGITFAVFMVPAGFGTAMNVVLGTWWGSMLNFWWMMVVVWHHVFGLGDRIAHLRAGRSDIATPLSAAIFSLCAATAICLLLLNKRLRAKEVVRG